MRLEVETHIITAPMSYWQNITKCIRQLGLTVNDIVFTGWASSLAVLTETEKELGVTMLDIGGGTTSVTIFQEGAIAYSGCIPLGGQNITSDIAIGLQVSLEDAEKIKVNMSKILSDEVEVKEDTNKPALLRQKQEPEKTGKKEDQDLVDVTRYGVETKERISKKMLTSIVEARLEEIFELVRDDVSKSGFDVAMPAGIVLTGGTSKMKDISKSAKAVFGVSVRIGYPSGLTGMIEEISDPSFSAVQGLIKQAMEDDVEMDRGGKGGFNPLESVGGVFSKVTDWVKSLMP
jgi:cell division protein FtsA